MSTRTSSRKTSLNSRYYNKDFVTDCSSVGKMSGAESADHEQDGNVVSDQVETADDVFQVETDEESDLAKELEELEANLAKQKTLTERSERAERHKANLARRQELKDQLAAACRTPSTSRLRQQANKSTKNVSIKDVRSNSGKKAQHLVSKALSASGVSVLDESTSEDEAQDSHGKLFNEYLEYTKSKKKRVKKRGSDILWPNEFISFQHTQNLSPVEFESLDCRLFAIGELEVCLRGGLAQEIANLRLDWLSEVLGYASHYDWKAILRLHAQVLHLTSLGRLSWGDEFAFSKLVSQFIFPHLIQKRGKTPSSLADSRSKSAKTTKPKADKYWCKDFNSAAGCPHEDGHKITFFDEITVMNHFCSLCYGKDKAVRNHSAKSSECPNKN